MQTKFQTAWSCSAVQLFSRSERLECESVILKWNICEGLVGCINVTANSAGRTQTVLKGESILLWKWQYSISQRTQLLIERDLENWRHDLILCYCGTPVKWRHHWYYVTAALQLNDVTVCTILKKYISPKRQFKSDNGWSLTVVIYQLLQQ
jgi:hypothetical protein